MSIDWSAVRVGDPDPTSNPQGDGCPETLDGFWCTREWGELPHVAGDGSTVCAVWGGAPATDPVYRIARRATPTTRFGACSGDDVVYRSREAAEARLAKIVELQTSLVRCFPLTYAAAEYRIEQAEPAWEAA